MLARPCRVLSYNVAGQRSCFCLFRCPRVCLFLVLRYCTVWTVVCVSQSTTHRLQYFESDLHGCCFRIDVYIIFPSTRKPRTQKIYKCEFGRQKRMLVVVLVCVCLCLCVCLCVCVCVCVREREREREGGERERERVRQAGGQTDREEP